MSNDEKNRDDFCIDEPVVTSFFIGELGWGLQRWFSFLRYLKKEVYPDRKFLLMAPLQYHSFVNDFVAYTIDLPKEFYDLKLDTDCYEAVVPGSKPGSLTPPDVYAALIGYFRHVYNKDKAIEIWTPRGFDLTVDNRPQLFRKYVTQRVGSDKPMITVFPRGRARASQRNVPEFIWREVVDELKKEYTVVLGGTSNGSFLSDYKDKNVINLIPYDSEDKIEHIIEYLNSSVCSVSSQSGLTHVSLLCDTPTYIIGHEKERHCVIENRFTTATSFRYVQDYRAIDAETILSDVSSFLDALNKAGWDYNRNKNELINRPSLRTLADKKDLVGVEIGVQFGENAFNMLENLDIKKLYLIDNYKVYEDPQPNKGYDQQKQLDDAKAIAKRNLDRYKDKVIWIEKLSEEAVGDVKDELDFVYVDGNHYYEYVQKDIELYYPKLKEGGLMGFHDFVDSSSTNGVKRAVEEFFGSRNIEISSGVSQVGTHIVPEAWIIKPISFSEIINNDTSILNSIIGK